MAFQYCTSLTSVQLPEGMVHLGEYAFSSCTALSEVTIPESVTDIPGKPFWNTPWMEARMAEETLVIINHVLIDGTNAQGDLVIPDDIAAIGTAAFAGDKALTSVYVPDSVTSIGQDAFGETGIREVRLPEGLTELAPYLFYHCDSLTSVDIPETVTFIGLQAFAFCGALRELVIPAGVEQADPNAFHMCGVLDSIVFLNPDMVMDPYSTFLDNGQYKTEFLHENVIYGYTGSTAQAYAETFGNPFIALDTSAGDLDGSGTVDLLDVIHLNRSLLGVEELDAGKRILADVDGSGKTDASDSLLILRYTVSLVDHLGK